MSTQQVCCNWRLIVAAFVIAMGSSSLHSMCFAQETAPASQDSPEAKNPDQSVPPAPKTQNSGIYHVGGGVTPPTVIHAVDPKYPGDGVLQSGDNICVVELVVDEKGKPQDVHVWKSVNPKLDANAVQAVQKYRFKPATFQGRPVPVRIAIKVNYRLP